MKFQVKVVEVRSKMVEVDSDSLSDACELVDSMYKNKEIVLNDTDVEHMTMEVK